MMMASHVDMEVKGDGAVRPRGKHLDCMAQQVQNVFKFRNFYDQINVSAIRCLAITEAITELTKLLGGLRLCEGRPRG